MSKAKVPEVQGAGTALSLPPVEQLTAIMSKNLKGMDPQFSVIKHPTGGGLAFEVPTASDDPDIQKELVGVIIEHYATRVFWKRSFDDSKGEKSPPDCLSMGGKEGEGDPGGSCLDCSNNKWGSGRNGGKACQERHQIFLLMGDSLFPVMYSAPPTSLKNLAIYATKLAGQMREIDTVMTKIRLVKDKNADQIDYSKLEFSAVGDLEKEDIQKVRAVSEALGLAMRDKKVVEAEFSPEKSDDAF